MKKIITVGAIALASLIPVRAHVEASHFTCTYFAVNAYQANGRCNNGADNYRVMARNTLGQLCVGYRASNGAWSVATCYNAPISTIWMEAPHF
jgi:hypothetical protein